MAKVIGYFALGFSQPGCMTNGNTYHAVTHRREIREAIEGAFYDDPAGARKAFADLGIRELWAHAKRSGFSVIFRELETGSETGERLCFMGMTEAEYIAATENDD